MRHDAADMGSTRAPDDLLIVVPARNKSRRFPGKLLTPIHGEALLRHTVKRALSLGKGRVLVAAADLELAQTVEDLCEVFVSDTPHPTGTDRVAEAWQAMAPDTSCIINLQGDEPCIPREALAALLPLMDQGTEAVSVCLPMTGSRELNNPNTVKVELSGQQATQFSRRPLMNGSEWHKHIGVYGFSANALRAHANAPQSADERAEDLEQLRLMALGFRFRMAILESWRDRPWPAINQPDDVPAVLRALSPRGRSTAPRKPHLSFT